MAPARQPKRPRAFSTTRPPLPSLFRSRFSHHRHSTGTIPEPPIPEEPEPMPLFPRALPALRLSAHPTREDEINAFLSSDVHAELELEDSFASNMSLNSPPHARRPLRLPDSPEPRDYTPMDISPAPPRVFHAPPAPAAQAHTYARAKPDRGRDTNHTMQLPLPAAKTAAAPARPRSNTGSGSRLFGTDVSNANAAGTKADDKAAEKDKSSASASGSGRRLQRAALPFEWMASGKEESLRSSGTQQSMDMPSSPSMDAMDVDMSYNSQSSSAPEAKSPLSAAPTVTRFHAEEYDDEEPVSAAPTVTKFNEYFYRSSSPIHAPEFADESSMSMSAFEPAPKKKRSSSPAAPQKRWSYTQKTRLLDETDDHIDSSPAGVESPSVHKLERLNSKPALRGLPLPSALNANNKRPRRPVLSAVVPSGAVEGMLHSAHPALEPFPAAAGAVPRNKENEPKARAVPVRRAFSAMIPASVNALEQSFEDTDASLSHDGMPDMSSPAAQAYLKRQQLQQQHQQQHQQQQQQAAKTLRRRDGTDDFRSVTGAPGAVARDGRREREAQVVAERDTPRSKYLSGGGQLGGFGDNEAQGKILPCRRVREDGLMRITCKTLDDLLDGQYDSQIETFHVIDCRFDYEYDGGHIPGAININTMPAVEDFLLGARVSKPDPCMSGDGAKKTILVFHCEFSQKRAPTFAKHLRSRDRLLNGHVYPRIHYPEVYILEGGYCQYYKESGGRCQPPNYVRMDDPNYATSRKEDLDQFRKGKFGRTKSYAYGEGKNGLAAALAAPAAQPKRNSAPTVGQSATTLFAAGNIARSRRTQGMLQTLQEDASGAQATDNEDDDTDIGDSPCPPPTKGVVFKGGKMPRMPLARAETYGPSRFGH